MNIIHEPLRYAHDEGHTDVCYSEDGENFITCGADGDIRIWSVNEGEDPHHTCIGEWALSVRQKNDKLYVATSSNEIQILSHPDGERDGVLTRTTDPYNQIAVCSNKDIAALAGEGMEVSIMDLETCSVINSFKELNSPCLSVALCPNASKVAASCGDGKLRVWDIESGLLVKETACFPKVNSFSNAKVLCRLDFYPIDGKYLAYPEGNSVKLLDTSNWSEETLSCENVFAPFSVLQFSQCGKYLAAATTDGDFVIWNIPSRNIFKTSKHENSKAICGLMWNPKGNGEIVYTDVEGQLSIMSNCLALKRIDEEKCEPIDGDPFADNDVDFGDIKFDDGDEDNENAISVENLKQQFLGSPEQELRDVSEASSRNSTPRPRTPETPLQSHFMPSSTPEHLDPRYMCWNDVGIIKSYGDNVGDEMASKSIEVEFHDTAFHNSMMLQNFQEYTMGSLSKGGLVVANTRQIMVIPLSASNREWTLKVEEYEEIILVAASESLICFATSNYIIRICSIFGTQRGIVSVPGPLVSMAAFKNVLLVAYHASGVRKNDQCINIRLYKFDGISVECQDLGSALGPESTLFWLGFSDLGTPGMMDSLGMLSLFPAKCSTWIPFCDTTKHRKGPADGFFVTTVFETYQAVGGIKCKGTVYPAFIPRPTMCELPLEPPYAEGTTEKTQMEMGLFTWSNLRVMETERKFKETALKTFALACKNDLDQRALEFMEIIGSGQILNLGLKYATKLNKKRLAEKLMELATKLQNEEEEKEEASGLHSSIIIATPDTESSNRDIIQPPPTYRRSSSKLTPKLRKSLKESLQDPNGGSKSKNNENDQEVVNTQESLFSDKYVEDDSQNSSVNTSTFGESQSSEVRRFPTPKNPFLKKNKTNHSNPLSLTDKYAGVKFDHSQSTSQKGENREKRKLSDSDSEKTSEKPVEKQRKLDMFLFSKW